MRLHVTASIEPSRAWCGEPTDADPTFKSAEEAALNGLFPRDNKICIDCAARIVDAIHKST
jgi:hypothetical protein